MGRGCGVWLPCVVVALLPFQIAKAQEASEPGSPTRRSITNSIDGAPDLTVTKRMVVINVTVHGEDGVPLRGLTARDFQISDATDRASRSWTSTTRQILARSIRLPLCTPTHTPTFPLFR
jgi:hypothetical protein